MNQHFQQLDSLLNQAVAFLKTNHPQNALTAIVEAEKIDMAAPSLNYLRGLSLLMMGDNRGAVDAFKAEIKINPGHPDASLFLKDLGGAPPVQPELKISVKDFPVQAAPNEKLRLALVYSIHPTYGKITLPEWIKECIRIFYGDSVEVFPVGPRNEYPIEDGPDFYQRVNQFIRQNNIHALIDIEGGAESLAFMFERYPEGIKIPKYFWAIDTHQYLDLQKKKAQHFDVVLSAQKNAVSAFGPKARWIPSGASLYEVDHGLRRTIDVGFVGNTSAPGHKKRLEMIDVLKREFPQFRHYQDIFTDEKARLVSRMKIMVNCSLNNDINFRVFETLACGALLITDKVNENGFEDIFQDGVHLVTYGSNQELVEKVRYYLKNDAEREKIARAGQELVRSKFRHEKILEPILEELREISGLKKSTTAISGTIPQTPAPAKEKTHCWCGGRLQSGCHKLYGLCDECGTQVLRREFTAQELKEFYACDHYWHDRQVQVFGYPPIEQRAQNDLHDRIPVWYKVLERFNPRPRGLLEIGCAHGGFLWYCRERGATDVVGIEVDAETCQFAKEHFKLPHVEPGLFPDVTLPIQQYDVICGFDVIEHFTDPIRAHQVTARLLKPGGIAFFQTPWFRGQQGDWVQFKPAEHTFLFSEKGVRKLFDSVGMDMLEVNPGFFPDDMFMVARKRS